MACYFSPSATAPAQMSDVQLQRHPEKLDEQKEREGGNTTITTKEVCYKVGRAKSHVQSHPGTNRLNT